MQTKLSTSLIKRIASPLNGMTPLKYYFASNYCEAKYKKYNDGKKYKKYNVTGNIFLCWSMEDWERALLLLAGRKGVGIQNCCAII